MINEIKIDLELKSLIPPLTADEFKQLEANILSDGCRDPLVLWGDTLVDGHNRYSICSEHKIGFSTVNREFKTKSHAKIWIRNNQAGRRNLSAAWRIELGLGNKADLSEIGKLNRIESKVGNQNAAKNIAVINDSDVSKHSTRETIATAANVSAGQVAKAEIIKREAPELWELAKAGDVTIGEAYKDVKNKQKIEQRRENIAQQKIDIKSGTIQLPAGVFEVVSIDPPWNYGREYNPESSRVANPYPEMTKIELLELKLPFADDSICLLWTTHAFIFDAKELLDNWGFVYKATMVWDKQKMGMGAWLRMQCEFCLIGIKGKPAWNNTKYRDIISESRREHSRKPDGFFAMIEDITIGRRLEYFSREKREGWEIFGNDTSKF